MTSRVTSIAITVIAACALTTMLDAGQRGREAEAEPAAPTPRLPNGKPDLSGLWQAPYTPNMGRPGAVLDPATREPLQFARLGEPLPDAAAPASGQPRTFDLPFTDWGLQQWEQYDPVANGDYAGNCLPYGMSRSINAPHGLQLIQNDDALAFLFEQNTWFHWVPTNGMEWPDDLWPTWTGVSTGHWEGDTLVVETTGFNGYSKLDTAGHPLSTELTLINTFLRTDENTIEHTVTVRDPKTFTREWMNVRTWRLRSYPDVIIEYSCEENNLQNVIDGSIKLWRFPEDVE